MVSFQCDGCGDVVKKPKLNQHGNRCYATFTCIDCSTTFQGTSYQSHNSCMTEAEKFQKHIYQNKAPTSVKGKAPAPAPAPAKPVSIIDQLNDKKRKSDAVEEPKEKKEKKEKKQKTLTEWSKIELDKDESKNLENALKEVLKDGKSLKLKDVRKKTIELIEKHPQYKKSDLKKSFDKKFSLTLKDNTITFA
ncbi:hypothetical protein BD770DRAFT_1009 [Pilaira anomala]|nr:hypothetical protein BD770DRAFT_1009 [Pilaira anomala]